MHAVLVASVFSEIGHWFTELTDWLAEGSAFGHGLIDGAKFSAGNLNPRLPAVAAQKPRLLYFCGSAGRF